MPRRRGASRSKSIDSIDAFSFLSSQRDTSSELLMLGDSAKDLLNFSRTLHDCQPRRTKMPSPGLATERNISNSELSPISALEFPLQSSKEVKTITKSKQHVDIFVPPFLEEKCSSLQKPRKDSLSFGKPQHFRDTNTAKYPSKEAFPCGSTKLSVETERQKQSLQWDRALVEIVPGYSVPLAGTQESIAAYQRQAVQEVVCQACHTELFCIDTASMMVCPKCRSFSSLNSSSRESEQLGLGLTVELLVEELERL